jgi:hypothetical protein
MILRYVHFLRLFKTRRKVSALLCRWCHSTSMVIMNNGIIIEDPDLVQAINLAITSSGQGTPRCSPPCNSTSELGAVAYFPPGIYLISEPLLMYYYTLMIGNVYTPVIPVGSPVLNVAAKCSADNKRFLQIPGHCPPRQRSLHSQ